MNPEYGLYIVKPDAIIQEETEEVVNRIEEKGLVVDNGYEFSFTNEQILQFYGNTPHEIEETWFNYLADKPSLALVVTGRDVAPRLFDVKQDMRANPNYQHDWFYTGHHSSDNMEDFWREMEVIGITNGYIRGKNLR